MKLISALVATFALSFSVLLAPSAATAGPAAYPGSVSTFCAFSVPTAQGPHHLTIRMRVRAGNALPAGHLAPRLFKRTSSGTYKLVRHRYLYYSGGLRQFTFRQLARGRYLVKYRYVPPGNSVFEPCVSTIRSIRITG